MNLLEAIKERHSVRSYTDRPLSEEDIDALIEDIAWANYKGNLDIQLIVDAPDTFIGGMAKYGSIKGASNYLAMVAPKGKTCDMRLGYYGEQIVLKAKARGLDTCWLGLSYNHSKMHARMNKGTVCPLIVVIGYGAVEGKPHKVKPLEELCLVDGAQVKHLSDLPRWFTAGLEAAQLAPSALNQQKYAFDLVGGANSCTVRPVTKGGPYTKADLGIAKCHFEIGALEYSDEWRWV